MKMAKKSKWMILCAAVALMAGQAAWAQTTTVPPRVMSAVDDTQRVTLKGNVHPLARAEFDQGPVSDGTPATRMLLVLQRSPGQETALRQLLDQQQDKTSANYHAWLTPAQFGAQFGPADADVQAVTGWLQSHGFQNVKVGAGRTTIEFSGNVGQVRNAFHTDVHQFLVHGEQHMANVSDPQIPAALAPVLTGVVGLHSFRPKALMHRMENYLGGKATGAGPKPQVTFTCGSGPCYGVAPGDFATIYNTTPLVSGSPKIDGTGVTIAIVQDSDVYATDIQQFNTLFGLTTNFSASNIIANGPDPGVQNTTTGNGDEGEAVLDVEWSGAVAPGATIDLVVSQDSATIGAAGIDLSADYIIQNNLAPIMSESFGGCESGLGTAGNSYYNTLWEQAAAQGITAILATGDNGSDMCDAGSGLDYGTSGLGISGLASTPFNVAVGGTDFQTAGLSGYWNAPGVGATESAKSYIPEQTWNSGCAATATTGNLTTCASLPNSGTGYDVLGSGGGQSAFPSVNGRPAWQVGVVPSADTGRDIPDLALFSAVNSSSNAFYITCQQDSPDQNGSACSLSGSGSISPVGGTSAAAPAFAGIMALVIQNAGGARQGNADYVLYQLYKKNTAGTICPSNTASVSATGCIFYDTITGNNSVACRGTTTDCSNQSSTSQYGVLFDPSNKSNPAFLAVAGYDKGTGLGSVNVTNLVKAWSTASFDNTSVALSAPSSSSITHGQTVNFTVTVTSTSGTPTGDVSLIATPSGGGTPVGIGAATNTSTSTFELVNGTASITTNILPGGTDSVVAMYGGDGTFAPNPSQPVTVTVSKESSQTTGTLLTYDSSDGLYDVTAPNPVVYGTTPYIMRVDVTNSGGTLCQNGTVPCPTGTITETYDNGLPLNDFANGQTGALSNQATLNVLGFLEDLPINLPAGSHTITATYSGDNSYIASSTSPAISLTVQQATTTTLVASNFSIITSGQTVTITATVNTQSSGAGPTGSVSFTNGSASIGSGKCQPTAGTATTPASCTATISAAISALYPPGAVRPEPPGVPLMPLVVALASLLVFAFGLRWMPTGRRQRAYVYAGLVAFALLAVGIAGCGGGSGGGGGGSSTRTITATYPGDTNYTGSTGSTSLTIQ